MTPARRSYDRDDTALDGRHRRAEPKWRYGFLRLGSWPGWVFRRDDGRRAWDGHPGRLKEPGRESSGFPGPSRREERVRWRSHLEPRTVFPLDRQGSQGAKVRPEAVLDDHLVTRLEPGGRRCEQKHGKAMVTPAGAVVAQEIQAGGIEGQKGHALAGHDEADLLRERGFELPEVRVDLGTPDAAVAVGIQVFALVLGAVLEKGQIQGHVQVAGARDQAQLVLDEAREYLVAVGGREAGKAAEPDQQAHRGNGVRPPGANRDCGISGAQDH